MIVILDANVIVANPYLLGSVWEQLSEAVAGGRVEVLLPQFAFDEAVAVYRRGRELRSLEVQAIARRTSKAVREILGQAKEALSRESEDYPAKLRGALQQVGVRVVRPPRVSHATLVAKAASRRRPFDEKGSGYRDALHWATVLEVVKERYEGTDIVFISNDRSAFGAGGSNADGLHPHLLEDLEPYEAKPPYFRWLRTMDEFVVPGVFEDEVGHEITLTPGEVAGFALSSLWDAAPLELLPRQLGLRDEPATVTILDIVDPAVDELYFRQYFDEQRFRADFNFYVAFELAMTFLSGTGPEDAVREELRTINFHAAAHADIEFGARTTEYVMSGFEIEELRAAEPDQAEPPTIHAQRPTYASGPVISSPYRDSVASRAQASEGKLAAPD